MAALLARTPVLPVWRNRLERQQSLGRLQFACPLRVGVGLNGRSLKSSGRMAVEHGAPTDRG